MAKAIVYIGFNGECREAMTFYKGCIGGELELQKVGGSPAEAFCPAEMKDNILHSTLTNGEFIIMATDMTGPGGFVKGNNMAVSVDCTSEEEITKYYNYMSEGGEILDELKQQFWGALFGVVTDKFGIRWMFNYNIKN